jgi:hypothetical protein
LIKIEGKHFIFLLSVGLQLSYFYFVLPLFWEDGKLTDVRSQLLQRLCLADNARVIGLSRKTDNSIFIKVQFAFFEAYEIHSLNINANEKIPFIYAYILISF